MNKNIPGIETLLLVNGWCCMIGGIIWALTEPTNHWLWFSRFALGIISIGFFSILKKMDKCGKN